MEHSSSDWLLGAFFEPKGAHTAGALLEACAQRLLAAGVRVGGLVQHTGSYASGGKRLELVDVASGERFEISQNLGTASSGCCINEQAMAHASSVLRRALEEGAELLVINRYGPEEADGGGFAAEFAQAAGAGVPVITTVGEGRREAWETFAGDMAVTLPLDEQAAVQLCLRRLGKDTR